MPRRRKHSNSALDSYPGLGQWKNGGFFFKNPHTGRQATLKTKDFAVAKKRWAVAVAIADKQYGDDSAARLAESIARSNTPVSRGDKIHLADFIKQWREAMLEPGKVMVKIKRNQGQPISERTKRDYTNQAQQVEALPEARFPVSDPRVITKTRKLMARWIGNPTHYNHIRAVLSRVFDHAVVTGLVEKNPMRDIDRLPVERREVLIPDDDYLAITKQLMAHKNNKRVMDGEWRAVICDFFYMLSQQPIDAFSVTMAQISLKAEDFSDPDPEKWSFGEIALSRSKTKVAGIISMNKAMREVVDWLIDFRKNELAKRNNRFSPLGHDNLLIYPAYMDGRSRWKPVKHRTFSLWWSEACEQAGLKGKYWLMDLRKKGLTDEFVSQGENDKGIHETDAMRRHYRLITPPKRSRNTLTSIRNRQKVAQ